MVQTNICLYEIMTMLPTTTNTEIKYSARLNLNFKYVFHDYANTLDFAQQKGYVEISS